MKKIMVLIVLMAVMISCGQDKSYELFKEHYDKCAGDTTVVLGKNAFSGELTVSCHETKEQREARRIAEKEGK